LCVPLNQYEGIIPEEAKKEMELVLKSNISVRGWIVADDIENIKKQEITPKVETPTSTTDWEGILKVALYSIGIMVALPFLLLMAAVAYDPMLIAVTEEGEFLCIYEWWD
jgi:hypothetical protein